MKFARGRVWCVAGAISVVPLVFDSAALATAVALGAAAGKTSPGLATSGPLTGVGGWLGASVAVAVAVGVAVQAVTGTLIGVYRGRAARASFDELVLLLMTVSLALLGVVTTAALSGGRLHASTVVTVAAPIALSIMIAARLGWRLHEENSIRSRGSGRPTIVFGAGEGGYQAVRMMLRDPKSPYRPVGLLDDDPHKRNLRVMGVPVLGGLKSLPRVVAGTGAHLVLAAVPSAGGELLGSLRSSCQEAGVQLKSLPSLHELDHGLAKVGDIRDVNIADVLGRSPSSMDLSGMAAYLTGKRVLVTGAGGSIGSELCRVLSRFSPEKIFMLDRDESALHAVQLSIEGRALLDSSNIILADIRDEAHVQTIFAEHRPEVVFHAAALKHLPLLERYPGEALKSNVWGTMKVLAACHDVERFINVSTDKAADPTSMLGWSKRVAERITAHGHAGTVCVSVRFGNVLGSRGSVLHTFAAQAQSGGPITVTHPEATRYFMTVTEAVHLVIAAGGIGRDGEALVLDMGEPANILEVAKLVSADHPVPIEFTGLRPGEKLHEQLFGSDEAGERPIHPLISHVAVPPLDPALTVGIDAWDLPERVAKDIVDLAQQRVGVQALPVTFTDQRPVPGQRSRQQLAI